MTRLGHDGLNKLLAGHEDKSARAVCTFALCKGPGQEPMLFQGVTEVRSTSILVPSSPTAADILY